MNSEHATTIAPVDAIVINPQPKKGRPFRFKEGTRGQGPYDWWNENVNYPRRGPMLFNWRCPLGINGKPELIDGTWYWVRIVPEPA